jgi:hypothetical protein
MALLANRSADADTLRQGPRSPRVALPEWQPACSSQRGADMRGGSDGFHFLVAAQLLSRPALHPAGNNKRSEFNVLETTQGPTRYWDIRPCAV